MNRIQTRAITPHNSPSSVNVATVRIDLPITHLQLSRLLPYRRARGGTG
jgi:hypothetical protein